MKLPIEFEARMRELLGEDFSAFLAAMDTENVRSLRVNTLKYNADMLGSEDSLCREKLPFCDDGYIFEHEHIGAHPLLGIAHGKVFPNDPIAVCKFHDIVSPFRVWLRYSLFVMFFPAGITMPECIKLK